MNVLFLKADELPRQAFGHVKPSDWNAPVSLIDTAQTTCNALTVDGESYSGVDLRTHISKSTFDYTPADSR